MWQHQVLFDFRYAWTFFSPFTVEWILIKMNVEWKLVKMNFEWILIVMNFEWKLVKMNLERTNRDECCGRNEF
jgi:hypothetical protein